MVYGWLDNDDPVIFLENLQFAMKNEPVIQFDFDGSGFIGYGGRLNAEEDGMIMVKVPLNCLCFFLY